MALGREGKWQLEIDASQYPCTAAMAIKLQTDQGQQACRRRKWIAGVPSRLMLTRRRIGRRRFFKKGAVRMASRSFKVCDCAPARKRSAANGTYASRANGSPASRQSRRRSRLR